VELLTAAPSTLLAQQAGGGDLGGLILPLVFLVVLYLLLIRPQSKRRKEMLQLNAGLAVGDLVATLGGIHGEVQELDDKTVDLAVTVDAEGRADVIIRFDRQAVVRVIEKVGAVGVDTEPDED
jgi:preprotein translocase subunit YajC